jgi:hypothetical protein
VPAGSTPRPGPSPGGAGTRTPARGTPGADTLEPATDTTPTGRLRPIRKPRPDAAALLPPAPSPRTAFRQRYGVVYDTQGPRVRVGILWAASVALALAFRPLRPYGLATLYAVVAGVAAMQVVDAWHSLRSGSDRWVAALGASTLPMLATLGVRPVGAGLLALVAAAVAAAALRQDRELTVLSAAGHTVLAAGVCGGASASMVLLADYEIGAVIILVLFLMVYDASDYLVGSGAGNGFEGPIAGGLFIAAVASLVAVTGVPPFRGADVWTFALLAALACPAGQFLASAMLPNASVRAPALRRLDSLLIVAPAWAGLVGLYLANAA